VFLSVCYFAYIDCWCSGDIDVRRSAATEALLKKLVEAEVDGQSIADQAAGFSDAIQRLREVSS